MLKFGGTAGRGGRSCGKRKNKHGSCAGLGFERQLHGMSYNHRPLRQQLRPFDSMSQVWQVYGWDCGSLFWVWSSCHASREGERGFPLLIRVERNRSIFIFHDLPIFSSPSLGFHRHSKLGRQIKADGTKPVSYTDPCHQQQLICSYTWLAFN